MKITREMLLHPEHGEGVTEAHLKWCESVAKAHTSIDGKKYSVWRFEDAPKDLQRLCSWNGGDEDWLVVVGAEPEYIAWIESLDSCHDPDVYLLDGVVIYVGSHA